ncbi:hypothetical protein [Streptomyces sp. NPDC008092]|uniref:hypothetical protein n=1 Tax=Streptomyces sp. NPDC008092 TaxID=3364808 RepID=UPI0036F018E6
MHSETSWSRRRTAALAFLLSAAVVGWTAVALSVHASGSAEPGSVTDADVARLGAAVMAGIAAVAAGLWWRHWATVRRAMTGGGWARAAFAVSAVHSVFLVPVIGVASWEWSAAAILFTCAVIAAGVREAAWTSTPATGVVASG